METCQTCSERQVIWQEQTCQNLEYRVTCGPEHIAADGRWGYIAWERMTEPGSNWMMIARCNSEEAAFRAIEAS